MSDHILIVENDLDIVELIKANMQDLGLQVTHCDNGEDAIKKALENNFSLIILSLSLSTYGDLNVCRQIKEANEKQAILMLAENISDMDLKLGADDFMTKPFNDRELQARVHAQLHQVHLLQNGMQESLDEDNGSICHGQLLIDQRTHEVVLRQKALDLTATEFDLLRFMAKHPGEVFSRTQLLDKVWGYQYNGYEHTVNSHINRLRNKLVAGQPQSNNKVLPTIIQTVFGVGYKFSPEGVI